MSLELKRCRRPIFVTPQAHKAVAELARMLRKETGFSKVSLMDAASLAIVEAVQKRRAAEKRPKMVTA